VGPQNQDEMSKAQELAIRIAKQLEEIQSYKDLAEATADVLKEHYGEHNYQPFIDELTKHLNEE